MRVDGGRATVMSPAELLKAMVLARPQQRASVPKPGDRILIFKQPWLGVHPKSCMFSPKSFGVCASWERLEFDVLCSRGQK